MSIKVYDKNDSFDVKVELSRKFIAENFGKRPIYLEKDDEVYTLTTDEYESVVVENEAYYHNTEEVLLKFGLIAQYQ